MGSWVGVAHDDVVKVGGDAFNLFDDLIVYLDKPPGRGTAALRDDEPFEKPGGCAERGEGDGVLIDGDLVEQGYQVEGRRCVLFPGNRGPRRRGGWGVVRGS